MSDITAADVRLLIEMLEDGDPEWCYAVRNQSEGALKLIAMARLALAVLEPEWRKEPPTEPGWYWFKLDDVLEVVECANPAGYKDLRAYQIGEEEPIDKRYYEFAQWSGPIAPPLRAQNAELRKDCP